MQTGRRWAVWAVRSSKANNSVGHDFGDQGEGGVEGEEDWECEVKLR